MVTSGSRPPPAKRVWEQRLPVPCDVWASHVLPYLCVRDVLSLGRVCRGLARATSAPDYWAWVLRHCNVATPELIALAEASGCTAHHTACAALRATAVLRSLLAHPAQGRRTLARLTTDIRTKDKAAPFARAYLGGDGRAYYWKKENRVLQVKGAAPPFRTVPRSRRSAAGAGEATGVPQAAWHHRATGSLLLCTHNSVCISDTLGACRAEEEGQEAGAEGHIVIKPRAGQGHSAAVACVRADYARVYTGSFDTTVKLWCRSEQRHVTTLRSHRDPVSHLLVDPLSPKCTWIATGACARSLEIRTHDLESGTSQKVQATGSRLCGLLRLEGDHCGSAFAAGIDNKLVVWDRRAAAPVHQEAVLPGFLSSVHATGNHAYFAGGETAPSIACVDLRKLSPNTAPLCVIEGAHTKPIMALHARYAESPSGTQEHMLLSSSRDGYLKLWDLGRAARRGGGAAVPCLDVLGGAGRGGVHQMEWCGTSLLLVRCQSLQVVDFSGRGYPTKSCTA